MPTTPASYTRRLRRPQQRRPAGATPTGPFGSAPSNGYTRLEPGAKTGLTHSNLMIETTPSGEQFQIISGPGWSRRVPYSQGGPVPVSQPGRPFGTIPSNVGTGAAPYQPDVLSLERARQIQAGTFQPVGQTGQIQFQPGMHAGDVATINRQRAAAASGGMAPFGTVAAAQAQPDPLGTGFGQPAPAEPQGFASIPDPSVPYAGPPVQQQPLGAGVGFADMIRWQMNRRLQDQQMDAARGGSGFAPIGPLDNASQQQRFAIQQAQNTTPQWAMQMNTSPTAHFGQSMGPTAEELAAAQRQAEIAAREQQVMDLAQAPGPVGGGGRFVPLGNTPPVLQSQPFGTMSSTVSPGRFGAVRLQGPTRTSEQRAASVQTRIRRQEEADQFRRGFNREGEPRFGELSPARQEALQQQFGRSFGVPKVGTEEYFGERKTGKLFPKGYKPVTDKSGNIDRAQTAVEAMDFIEGFEGDRAALDKELETLGLTWNDMRGYAAEELLPSLWEKSMNWTRFGVVPFFSEADRIGLQTRARRYQQLRKFDPTLPPMPPQLERFLPPGVAQEAPGSPTGNRPFGEGRPSTGAPQPFGTPRPETKSHPGMFWMFGL